MPPWNMLFSCKNLLQCRGCARGPTWSGRLLGSVLLGSPASACLSAWRGVRASVPCEGGSGVESRIGRAAATRADGEARRGDTLVEGPPQLRTPDAIARYGPMPAHPWHLSLPLHRRPYRRSIWVCLDANFNQAKI